MHITRASTCVALCLLALGPLSRLNAQATVGLKMSTLGFGPEVGFSFAPRVGVRGAFKLAAVSRDLTSDGIDYSASMTLNSIHALLDLYLVGPFRLSGGLIRNGNKLELSADPTVSVDVGDTTYTASSIGTMN